MLFKIFILLLFTTCLNAQVKPILEIETGYYSYVSSFSTNLGSNITSDINKYPIYSNVILGAKLGKFSVYQTIENFFGYKEKYSFDPYQIRYTTGLSFDIKKFKLNYEHMCFHPVLADTNSQFEHFFFNSYDKLTLKFKIF